MPVLDAKDYAEFNRILEELEPEFGNLNGASESFARDMHEKNQLYGARVFVSLKQLDWLKRLHEEFVGNTAHEKSDHLRDDAGARQRDLDDDIPF